MDRPHHKFWPQRLPQSPSPCPPPRCGTTWRPAPRRYPDKPALVFFGRDITLRASWRRRPSAWPARLHALGVQRGDRVVLDMQNCPQLVIAHFAILRANAVVVPVNPMNRAEELKHYITDPDAKVAITTGDLAAETRQGQRRAAAGRAAGAPDRHAVHRRLRCRRRPATRRLPPAWRDWLLHAPSAARAGRRRR